MKVQFYFSVFISLLLFVCCNQEKTKLENENQQNVITTKTLKLNTENNETVSYIAKELDLSENQVISVLNVYNEFNTQKKKNNLKPGTTDYNKLRKDRENKIRRILNKEQHKKFNLLIAKLN